MPEPGIGTRGYMLSDCCNAYVVVPVEVTAHFLVRGNGALSHSLIDTLSTLRRQALSAEADLAEAYCAECGKAVAL
jgi:hypothetical protein